MCPTSGLFTKPMFLQHTAQWSSLPPILVLACSSFSIKLVHSSLGLYSVQPNAACLRFYFRFLNNNLSLYTPYQISFQRRRRSANIVERCNSQIQRLFSCCISYRADLVNKNAHGMVASPSIGDSGRPIPDITYITGRVE